MAEVTIPHPSAGAPGREFHVHVGAASDAEATGPGSPSFAGTIAFFGTTPAMQGMSHDATFLVPLPKNQAAFKPGATATTPVNIRVVSTRPGAKQPVVKSISIHSR